MSDEDLISMWQLVAYFGAILMAIGTLGAFLVEAENADNTRIDTRKKSKRNKKNNKQ